MLVALISWIAVGVIAGAVGGKVVNLRGDDPRLGLLVGAIAASVGGFAFRFFSSTITTGPGLWSPDRLGHGHGRIGDLVREPIGLPRVTAARWQ